MRILTEKMFNKIKDVKLNRDGKVIGSFVIFRSKLYYYTHRTSEHYFIKYKGLGLDKVLLRKMTSLKEKPDDLFGRIQGIIVFYDGEREKRFYFVDPFDWDDGITYGTAKEFNGEVQSYGEQKIYPMAKMILLGLHPYDFEAKNKADKINQWDKYDKKRKS